MWFVVVGWGGIDAVMASGQSSRQQENSNEEEEEMRRWEEAVSLAANAL